MVIELERAPDKVKNLLFNFSKDSFERVNLTKEAQELGQLFVNEELVGQSSIEDCYHIAMASINNVDVLASWNFKHIVNFTRIEGYNSVNLKNGYNLLKIRKPKDLIGYGNE